MNISTREAVGAQLAEMLPSLDLSEHGPLRLVDGEVGQADPDLHLALLVEARSLVAQDEALQKALQKAQARKNGGATARKPGADDELRRLTVQAVKAADDHRADALWALLGGQAAAAPSATRKAGRLGRMRRALFSEGLLARSVAALWMNLLVLGTAAIVVATLWGGFHLGTDGRALSLALLKLFALWCLSFMPGWLYVRFLGQRAGALWNEFVI